MKQVGGWEPEDLNENICKIVRVGNIFEPLKTSSFSSPPERQNFALKEGAG